MNYGERHEMMHDLQLWALRSFLADAAGDLAAVEPPPALIVEAAEFFATWEWSGPGVVLGTDLGEFVRGDPRREEALVQVCDRAAGRIRSFGEFVPLNFLAERVNVGSPGGVYIYSQPSAAFVHSVERIRGLKIPDVEADTAPGRGSP